MLLLKIAKYAYEAWVRGQEAGRITTYADDFGAENGGAGPYIFLGRFSQDINMIAWPDHISAPHDAK